MPTIRMPMPAPSAPSFDTNEVRWAAAELTSLLRQTEPGSPVEAVLTQAVRELTSLTAAPGQVVGPFRVAA